MYRPEVGEECWVQWPDTGPDEKVEITYISDEVGCYKKEVYGQLKEFTFATNTIKFRPLKSNRDEEIGAMCSAAKFENLISLKETMSNLYNAGYRKQMPYAEFVQIITDYLYDNFTDYDNAMSDAAELAAKLNRTPDEG